MRAFTDAQAAAKTPMRVIMEQKRAFIRHLHVTVVPDGPSVWQTSSIAPKNINIVNGALQDIGIELEEGYDDEWASIIATTIDKHHIFVESAASFMYLAPTTLHTRPSWTMYILCVLYPQPSRSVDAVAHEVAFLCKLCSPLSM